MKRATGRYNSTVDICAISIHALVKRATGYLAGALSKVSNFNPRPREEGDLTEKSRSYPPSNFNPRPREEGDTYSSQQSTLLRYFNPRPREEGDTDLSQFDVYPNNFNPRPREEGDTFR